MRASAVWSTAPVAIGPAPSDNREVAMAFDHFVEHYYGQACALQKNIESDTPLLKSLRAGTASPVAVESWMTSYNLFQGRPGLERRKIAKCFLEFANEERPKRAQSAAAVRQLFGRLHNRLHAKVNRGWTSATSKLLWCLYPRDVAMYDRFVHGSLVVLQCTEPALEKFKRLGPTPRIGDDHRGLLDALEHYMCYQQMVKVLLNANSALLKKKRKATGETYPYDIRIVDKLLWMMGNAGFSLTGER